MNITCQISVTIHPKSNWIICSHERARVFFPFSHWNCSHWKTRVSTCRSKENILRKLHVLSKCVIGCAWDVLFWFIRNWSALKFNASCSSSHEFWKLLLFIQIGVVRCERELKIASCFSATNDTRFVCVSVCCERVMRRVNKITLIECMRECSTHNDVVSSFATKIIVPMLLPTWKTCSIANGRNVRSSAKAFQ